MFHMEIQAFQRMGKAGRDLIGSLNLPVCRINKTIGTTSRPILEYSRKKQKDT